MVGPDLKRAQRTGLSARRARRTKSRGPKGLQLEVGARRAPRLLVLHMFYTLCETFYIQYFTLYIFFIAYIMFYPISLTDMVFHILSFIFKTLFPILFTWHSINLWSLTDMVFHISCFILRTLYFILFTLHAIYLWSLTDIVFHNLFFIFKTLYFMLFTSHYISVLYFRFYISLQLIQ